MPAHIAPWRRVRDATPTTGHERVTNHNRWTPVELRNAARDIMRRAGFDPDFPPDVLREVAALTEREATERADVRDLTALPWISIDNRGTRGIDQLHVATLLPNDGIRLHIAIADVDVLVPKGSRTDDHAAVNTTSIYTGVARFPMLPDKLSSTLTSFLPDEERRAVVVTLDVSRDGAIAGVDASCAIVRNRARLSYEAADDWLNDGRADDLAPALRALPELADQLKLQSDGARRLLAARDRQSVLSTDTVEATTVSADGEVIDLAVSQSTRSHLLIEALMVATNAAVARWLEERRIPALRRVVRVPRRWDRLVSLAADVGEVLPLEPSSSALGDFLARRRLADPAHYPDLALTVVKLLGPGEYILERRFTSRPDDAHFAVGAAEYTHSTAPNRRFVDLVVQRLLKSALGNGPAPYDETELTLLARHCTDREDAARKVERTMRKRAAAILMAERVGDSFPALVTGASSKGTYVRLLRPPVEGRVVRGERDLDVGDTVRVRLVAVDVERGYIDFENTAGSETRRKVERSRRKKQLATTLASRVGQEFDAVVTKAAHDGTYVRLTSEEGEGRVVRGEHGLAVGQAIRVRLIGTDPVHGFVDFELPEGIGPRQRERTTRKQQWAARLRHEIGARYEAIVTGVTPRATWIRTLEPEVEGRLVRGLRGLDVGDRLRVILLSADAERGWIDFAREQS